MSEPVSAFTIRCACCGCEGRHKAHGWIVACYHRWQRAGKPEDGPPAVWRSKNGRLEDYAWLTRDQGLSLPHAAGRMGVCERTAWRYEAQLRQRVAA